MRLAGLFLCTLLSGCVTPGQHFDVDAGGDAAPAGIEIQRLTPQVVQQLANPAPELRANPALDEALKNYEYRIGARDVLIFTVWDHPELTIPAGEFRSPAIQGHLVSPAGEIFFPYVGRLQVAGKTVVEVRDELTERLGRFIQDPQLDVRIADFRSKLVNVSGQVAEPGSFALTDSPVTLVEAVALAGGATAEAALQQVQVLRDGRVQRFDLLALWYDGDMTQNVLLQDGDVVYVPANNRHAVHVMGSVAEPGVVALADGRLNLAEALNLSGGFDTREANAGRVFVFRHERDGAQAFWLDAASPDAMLLATQFELAPQDVVFVASSNLARWNRVVSLILPTIQTLWQTQSLIEEVRD